MTIVELSDEYKELVLDIRKFIKFERRKEPDEIVSGFIVNIEPNNEILTVKIGKYTFIDSFCQDNQSFFMRHSDRMLLSRT